MISWMFIDSEETLERYQELNTPLNPVLYPTSIFWDTQCILGYYDSENQRGLFAHKLDSGEDERVKIDNLPFLLLCDKENLLEWKQFQHGDLTNAATRAFRIPTHRNGKYVYFGRLRLGNKHPIGQVCEYGICYIPTLLNGVIRISDFEILMYRDVRL
ncbi:Hypothetical predicted protein [Cloeon dipterum]|uniref:Uncharacterized protein n=1 Tax=Cloeon dipterum TaxID=197152 RepID=A0A8S1DTK4_9INSE|nr:Hypothetical predicted protein [Cloeon dipterum]